MKAIVCFSGGHSSALAAIETVRRFGSENTVLLNHDISPHVEHEDIKRFKREVSDYCGVPITYANSDIMLTPLEVALSKRTFGAGPGKTFCTSYLKTYPFYRYLESIPKSKDIHIIYGFDSDEIDRIQRRSDIINAMGYTPEFPLAYWNRSIENIEDVGIMRPVTYRIYKHANCIGCLKAGKQHWYCVFCTRPDIWEEAKLVERQLGYSIIKGVFLEELEPKFVEMRDFKHICPNDKEESHGFWSRVESILPEQETFFPCDCIF